MVIFAASWSAGWPRPSARRGRGAGHPADETEMAQGLGIGASQARLAVGQSALPAVFPDQGLGASQIGPWHGGKEVMFDLIVQPPQSDVGQPSATDVAGGQYLAPQEVTPVSRIQDRHALVVGGEGSAQVQAEQALLDQDEHAGLHRW